MLFFLCFYLTLFSSISILFSRWILFFFLLSDRFHRKPKELSWVRNLPQISHTHTHRFLDIYANGRTGKQIICNMTWNCWTFSIDFFFLQWNCIPFLCVCLSSVFFFLLSIFFLLFSTVAFFSPYLSGMIGAFGSQVKIRFVHFLIQTYFPNIFFSSSSFRSIW